MYPTAHVLYSALLELPVYRT